ncbi:MAG: hypothetical protein ACOC87_00920 [Candidatus Natronoplasma sp.]
MQLEDDEEQAVHMLTDEELDEIKEKLKKIRLLMKDLELEEDLD